MITVAPARITRAGVADPTPVSDDGSGFTIPDNDGNLTLRVANPTGDDLVISFTATATLAGETFPPLSVTVPAGATLSIGPFPPVLYNDPVEAVNGVAATDLTLIALGI